MAGLGVGELATPLVPLQPAGPQAQQLLLLLLLLVGQGKGEPGEVTQTLPGLEPLPSSEPSPATQLALSPMQRKRLCELLMLQQEQESSRASKVPISSVELHSARLIRFSYSTQLGSSLLLLLARRPVVPAESEIWCLNRPKSACG